jgi:hypothetical protein
MSIADVLIIAGCLAAGYWIVSSVMGPGSPKRPSPPEGKAVKVINAGDANLSNWYLILDVSEFAKRDEITTAYQRKLAQLKGDPHAAESEAKLRAAYDMGMKLFRQGKP